MNRSYSALRRSPDLLVLAVLGGVLCVLIVLDEVGLARSVLASVYLLFAPGYVLMAALHPRRQSIELPTRLALSVALSLAVVPLVTLSLDYLPWGIELWSSMAAISAFMLALAMIAIIRRALLPPGEAFPAASTREEEDGGDHQSSRWKFARFAFVAALSGGAVLGTLAALGVYANGFGTQPQQFTEFYLLGPGSAARDYPRQAVLGQPVRVVVGILNEEGRVYDYRVEAREGEQVVAQLAPQHVPDGERRQTPLEFVPTRPGTQERFEFALYRGDERQPYRTLHLFIEVTPAGATATARPAG